MQILAKTLFGSSPMVLLPDTQKCGLRMRQECRERFPATDFKGNHWLAIPACITERAVMHVGIANPGVAGKTFPAPPVHAQHAILRIW